MYDPYLDTLGGGEKYIFSIASCLSSKHEVVLFWDDPRIIEKAKNRFSLQLSHLITVPNIFSPQYSQVERAYQTSTFDVLIYMSDGSIPWLFAKKNILIFQFPVGWVKGKSFLNRLKLSRVSDIICYSDFVKDFIDKTFDRKSIVIPPSVEVNLPINIQKEKVILSVGRFTKAMNAKKQEVLIETFKAMCEKGLKGWRLVLVGGVLEQDTDLIEDLQMQSQDYPIEIYPNSPYREVMEWYAKAKIYWHAAGFGEDLSLHPERSEHFGITTVEAMLAGCVPVVISAGGQKEIVRDGENGFLWESLEELEKKTGELIHNQHLWQRLSESARKKGEDFREDVFCKRIQDIL